MPSVWVFEVGIDYEGESVAGIYSTSELAESALEQKMKQDKEKEWGFDYYLVSEWAVDGKCVKRGELRSNE